MALRARLGSACDVVADDDGGSPWGRLFVLSTSTVDRTKYGVNTFPTGGSTTAKKLTAEPVIEGAVGLADRIGADALTIRKIADEIDAEPMTIYHHVPNREAIIDGMVDAVFAEIKLPPTGDDWRSAILVRCRSMREVLTQHPWAAPLMESRTNPGMATLGHHDAVLGCLRSGGLSLQLTGHAYARI